MPRAVRKANNQALFREVNERIASLASKLEVFGGTQAFFCECDRVGCRETLELPLETYAQIRDDPTAFVVLRGHEDPRREAVVSDHGSYLIVCTRPATSLARIAPETS
jgi:hypothetical protein